MQFWTSRGFAYLDVNYGGSTGYGRAYRERLRGASGVVDVGDCVAGARHLAAIGAVDPTLMLIHGGSAGGYIVLCALAFHDVFAAGTSLYGIADLELLHEQTHKFEARYDDSLTGPYPEQRERYRERSPIHFIDRVRAALLLLQGTDDPVVPPNQTQMMFDALRAAGVPCACIMFPGEQHGFRDAASIRSSPSTARCWASTSPTMSNPSPSPTCRRLYRASARWTPCPSDASRARRREAPPPPAAPARRHPA